MAAPYNILILGASYGSLLASKLLFGGHTIKLVCLPAEADLINAEGFRVRLPVRGRSDAGRARLRGSFRARSAPAGPPASIRGPTISSALPCRSRNIALPGVRELLDAVGRAKVPCMSIMNMPPLAYLRRIPGLDTDALKAGLYRRQRLEQFRSGLHHAVQSRSAGDPAAGRKGQRSASDAADQLQGRALSFRTAHRDAAAPAGGDRGDPLRYARGQGRASGEAQGLRFDLRAACQMGDAARRQLSLRHQGRHAHRPGGGV